MGFFSFIVENVKSIFKFFWFIIKDFIEDIKFIIYAIRKKARGEQVLDPKKVEAFTKEMKTITLGELLKGSWHWILVILFAGVVGWFMGSVYTEGLCNNYIYETYIIPELEMFGTDTSDYIFNQSFLD